MESHCKALILNHPDVRLLINQQPGILTEYNVEELIQESFALNRNNDSLGEMGRLTDVALDNWESEPGGLLEMVQNYEAIEKTEIANLLTRWGTLDAEQTMIPGKPKEPSTEPLMLITSTGGAYGECPDTFESEREDFENPFVREVFLGSYAWNFSEDD
jgi:hypothetical protein